MKEETAKRITFWVRFAMCVFGSLAVLGCVAATLAGPQASAGVGFGLAAGAAGTFLVFDHLMQRRAELMEEMWKFVQEAARRSSRAEAIYEMARIKCEEGSPPVDPSWTRELILKDKS